MNKSILLTCIIFLFSTGLVAQEKSEKEEEIFAIHPKVGYMFNMYSADFRQFDKAVDCGLKDGGSGSGLIIGLFGELPLSDKLLIGLGLGYADRSGSLVNDRTYQVADLDLGLPQGAEVENTLEAKLAYLEIMPEIRYTVAENFISGPLRLMGGFKVGMAMTNTFGQEDKILSPSDIVYKTNNQQTRPIVEEGTEITSINSTLFGLQFGIENMLEAGKNNYFTQQISMDYMFGDIVSDATWSTYSVKLELGYRFSFTSSPEEPPVIETKPDTVAPPPPPPVIVYDPEISLEKLTRKDAMLQTGNELLATRPLVNAVFFDRNSASIPSKYRTTSDIPNPYWSDAVELHEYVLPRIALIMKNNPKAKITLEGATSGGEDEPRGKQLATERANNVKDALVGLGVEASKIKVTGRVMPKYQSNQDFEEGKDENQRVDILVKNAPLQEYVDLQKYAEVSGKVELGVEFKHLDKEEKIWIETSLNEDKLIIDKQDKYTIDIKNRISEDDKYLIYTASLKYDDLTETVIDTIDIASLKKEVIDLNLENFEAILRFDYNSSQLSDDNKGLLKQLSEKLPEGTTLTIYGSADALGSDQRNRQLATERAQVTEDYLKSVSNKNFKINTSADPKKFNESTPEGRFLNRAIRVRVSK